MENFGNVVSSDRTPWVNQNTGNSSGKFVVFQVFTSKAALQDVVKLYSIKAHKTIRGCFICRKIASVKMQEDRGVSMYMEAL